MHCRRERPSEPRNGSLCCDHGLSCGRQACSNADFARVVRVVSARVQNLDFPRAGGWRAAGRAGRGVLGETLGRGRSERGIPGAVCRVHALRCVPGRMAAGRAARLEQQAAMSTRQGRTGSRDLGNSARRGRQRAGESGAGAAEGRSRLADGDPVAMFSLVTGSRCGSAGRAARRRKMLHRADNRGRRGAQRQKKIAGGLAGGGAAHCGHRPLRGFLER
jgi:hypothetical protein